MNPTPPPTIPDYYTKWLHTGWSLLGGIEPGAPVKERTRKAALIAAGQEWEDEGGSLLPVEK